MIHWELIKHKLKLFEKPLSEERWATRIEKVKAILLQHYDVIKWIRKLKTLTKE